MMLKEKFMPSPGLCRLLRNRSIHRPKRPTDLLPPSSDSRLLTFTQHILCFPIVNANASGAIDAADHANYI